MSPPRRRSARIASSSKRPKASPAPQLESLAERDEAPEDQPKPAQKLATIMSSPMHNPRTPSSASPIKLPMSEMHPSKVHPSMAAPSSGLRLGFADIDYAHPSNEASGLTQTTPSKTSVPSSDFTFRHARPNGEIGLGPEAQKMMAGIREEAAKIKADLTAQRDQELEEQGESAEGRKIAKAKGKAGRFSAVHMAEFKKMDSIEGHPSAFRAAPGRFTPMKAGLKRSQSKANLDEPDSARSKKRTSASHPVPKSSEKAREEPEASSKRVRQRLEDDASTLRPVSRDDSSIPRPKSSGNDSTRSGIPRSHTSGSLMTPTKSSLARVATAKTPTLGLVKSPSKPEVGSLIRSPSKVDLGGNLVKSPSKKAFGGFGLMKSATTNNLNHEDGVPTNVQTPGRFGRVKSILKRQIGGARFTSNIPQFAASIPKTPASQKTTGKELPSIPLTTPGRKAVRHVDFTPDTKQDTMTQISPSPVKSSIPRSQSVSKLALVNQPPTTQITNDKDSKGEVSYPDLSAYCQNVNKETPEIPPENPPENVPQSVPGTFTFRSDHTIRFDGTSPNGFGVRAGQASVRRVRESMAPPPMPGSFPAPRSKSPNKENKDPATVLGIPHGMSNKKRHRATWDEEEEEGEKRVAKKLRKEPPAEGYAVVAPRLAGLESPSPTKKLAGSSRTPSPQKKRTGLTLSRLNMLARPKIRK
ncbi:hypothetical protein F5X99DRAFT_378177 [Biscogniauxia marginata]|nr:hypothetical protein F5X99DRAFT_378177 [Biscogniauxia marginata]